MTTTTAWYRLIRGTWEVYIGAKICSTNIEAYFLKKSVKIFTCSLHRYLACQPPLSSSPSAIIVHAAAAHPAVPSVNSRPSLVSCRSLHFVKHSARRRPVCTVCLFLPATAKDFPVSPIISRHHNLNVGATLSWTLQQFRLFYPR